MTVTARTVQTRDADYGWDGKLKDGSMAATAVYVYIINWWILKMRSTILPCLYIV
jgi:hypothetical protein